MPANSCEGRARTLFFALCILALFRHPANAETLKPSAVRAWDEYIQKTERRIDAELSNPALWTPVSTAPGVAVRKVNEQTKVDGGMIHHWHWAIFLPGVKLDRVLDWVQDYNEHHKYF